MPENPYPGLTKYQLKTLYELELRDEDIANWHEWWFRTFPSGLMPRSSFRTVFENYCPRVIQRLNPKCSKFKL
jgi:hypothetical protein